MGFLVYLALALLHGSAALWLLRAGNRKSLPAVTLLATLALSQGGLFAVLAILMRSQSPVGGGVVLLFAWQCLNGLTGALLLFVSLLEPKCRSRVGFTICSLCVVTFAIAFFVLIVWPIDSDPFGGTAQRFIGFR